MTNDAKIVSQKPQFNFPDPRQKFPVSAIKIPCSESYFRAEIQRNPNGLGRKCPQNLGGISKIRAIFPVKQGIGRQDWLETDCAIHHFFNSLWLLISFHLSMNRDSHRHDCSWPPTFPRYQI